MKRLEQAGLWLWDFVIGDDPAPAFIVALGVGLTFVLSRLHVTSWWVMPVTAGAAIGAAVTRS